MKFDATKLKKIATKPLNVGNIVSDIDVNNICITKGGEPFYIVSGEFHYSRYDNRNWEVELLKMKAAGCNTIATYCFWNHHEYNKGEWNFAGDMNLNHFLSLCNKHGLYVIIRLGPWCHGEVVLGGLPRYVAMNPLARTNNKLYLRWVRELYKQYYEQTKEYFYPHGTVIAAQLENEYTGKYAHIQTLKDMAIEIGFRLPIFTATAWPARLNDEEVLPMLGCYPEAPWTQHIRPLESGDKFKIMPQYHDDNIGNDTIKVSEKSSYNNTPLAYCELGAGVQVTTHRRPIISVADAYSMALATVAKGANLLGYYIFHGGRNPNFAPMQETKRTFYPNNLPLLSYDFQAPINEYGYANDKVAALNLLHNFCLHFDKDFPNMQAIFSSTESDNITTSIRVNADGRGYHFVSAYERSSKALGGEFEAQIVTKIDTICLPKLSIDSGDAFFYPFNYTCGKLIFRYITAQPYLDIEQDGTRHIYMIKLHNNDVKFSANAPVNGDISGVLELGDYIITDVVGANTIMHIITMADARMLKYNVQDGRVYHSKDFVYFDNNKAIVTRHKAADNHLSITVTEVKNKSMKYDTYLYGKCKPRLYKLSIPQALADEYDDVKISFKFAGDMAHVYVDGKVVADYININNDFYLYLSRIADAVREGKDIYIRTNAIASVQYTYYEVNVTRNDSILSIHSVTTVHKEEING